MAQIPSVEERRAAFGKLGLDGREMARIRTLVRVMDHFQAHNPQVPLAIAEAFLLVALNEGASLRELCEISGQPQSTMSRHLLDLGDKNRKGEPGMKLVEWEMDPWELRRKMYRLTTRGRKLMRTILEDMER